MKADIAIAVYKTLLINLPCSPALTYKQLISMTKGIIYNTLQGLTNYGLIP